MISANAPEDIDYTAYGINNALVIDNTGVFTNREALSRHLSSKGTEKVLLTAPGKKYQILFTVLTKENLI